MELIEMKEAAHAGRVLVQILNPAAWQGSPSAVPWDSPATEFGLLTKKLAFIIATWPRALVRHPLQLDQTPNISGYPVRNPNL